MSASNDTIRFHLNQALGLASHEAAPNGSLMTALKIALMAIDKPDQPAVVQLPAPVWDAHGVSQPMGEYGLVQLRDIEEQMRPNMLASGLSEEYVTSVLPKLYACKPGLAKLTPGSDNHWIVSTEISGADFGGLGTNPFEALLVNTYIRTPPQAGQVPSDWLKPQYQSYVPHAMALPSVCNTAEKCVAKVAGYMAEKVKNDRVVTTGEIDFGPYPH